MSRRPVSLTRHFVDTGGLPLARALHSKSRSSPALSVGLIIVGAFLLILYASEGSGIYGGVKGTINVQGSSLPDSPSPQFARKLVTVHARQQFKEQYPFLKRLMETEWSKVLHVGPDTCSVVSKLLKEEETDAWGVEPYDIEDAEGDCKTLLSKGIVRVADIKFPLPYRKKSFSLVIVSDALDYLSPKYLNKTLPELAKLSVMALLSLQAKMRGTSWWIQLFQAGFEENELAIKRFEHAVSEKSYTPNCQVFHIESYS